MPEKTTNVTTLSGRPRPYVNPYLGGTLLGLVLFLAFMVTGGGLGASGGIDRLQLAVVDALAPDHVDRTAYLARLAGGDRDPLAHPVVYMVLGVLAGGFASGMIAGRVRPETRRGPRISRPQRWALALLGGLIMGYGARLARGCTSGQALSGGAVLSEGSWLFMFAVFGGAYLLAYSLRRVWT
jgi:hypothetical protein